jgi:hypothetical protein
LWEQACRRVVRGEVCRVVVVVDLARVAPVVVPAAVDVEVP